MLNIFFNSSDEHFLRRFYWKCFHLTHSCWLTFLLAVIVCVYVFTFKNSINLATFIFKECQTSCESYLIALCCTLGVPLVSCIHKTHCNPTEDWICSPKYDVPVKQMLRNKNVLSFNSVLFLKKKIKWPATDLVLQLLLRMKFIAWIC